MTITIKNVPDRLHKILKRQAREEKRSLNQEVIKCLEEKAGERERPKAMAEAIRFRNAIAQRIGKVDKRLNAAKLIRADRDRR